MIGVDFMSIITLLLMNLLALCLSGVDGYLGFTVFVCVNVFDNILTVWNKVHN